MPDPAHFQHRVFKGELQPTTYNIMPSVKPLRFIIRLAPVLSALLLASGHAHAGFWDEVKKVGRKAVRVATAPARLAIDVTKKTAKGAVAIPVGVVKAVKTGDIRKVGEGIVQTVGTPLNITASVLAEVPGPLLSPALLGAALPSLMEPPNVEKINAGNYGGEIVYFVNGIRNSHSEARNAAKKLSNRLKRPVGLLYNPTHGAIADAAESLYDRAWIRSHDYIQLNAVTRKATHLLYHSRGKISIVSHSQGTLIVRNALVAASSAIGDNGVDRRTAWVATGAPLTDGEIVTKPGKLRVIANTNDAVAQGLGLRTLNTEADYERNASGHNFVTAYLNSVRLSDLW